MPLYQHVHGRPADARPVRHLRRRRGGRVRQGGRPGQPRAAPDRPRRLGEHAGCATGVRPQGQRAAARRPAARRQRPTASGSRAGPTSSSGSTARGCCPAIVFIFSRVGCDAAVQQCLNAGLRLTTPGGARRDPRVRRGARARDLPDEDLHVLGYHDFLDGLTRGVAAHHAGMLPTFKECVEELFAARPVQGRCSPPRRWRSASTCRPARWSSRSCRSGTARPTPTSRRGSTPS